MHICGILMYWYTFLLCYILCDEARPGSGGAAKSLGTGERPTRTGECTFISSNRYYSYYINK
jgi:hypothetical protein